MAPNRARADTVCPTTRNPSASATNRNMGSNATPARAISCRMRGPITFRATPFFFNMTPSVISANAPSPWTVSKKRKNFRPSRSVYDFGSAARRNTCVSANSNALARFSRTRPR